jgi:hypothetical protein
MLFLLWTLKFPKIPECPPCINKVPDDTANLILLNKYLMLVIKKYDAEKELYRLMNGFHQVYNSPKLDLLNKEIKQLKEEVKSNKATLTYFKTNLDNLI